jgi:hypothetical protein
LRQKEELSKGKEGREMTKFFRAARHWLWIVPIAIGIGFIGGGAYMIVEGRDAHDEVQDSIIREDITVSDDAPAFAGETVDSPGEAEAQSDAILQHTLTSTGGYLYAEIGRFFLPEGNYMLPNSTYATPDRGTTQDVSAAATDDDGNPIVTTTDESQAAKNASDQPVRAWTNDEALAAKDPNGVPVQNTLRNTAKDSAFLRTSLGVAVMGFRVSDLVVGLGAFMIVIGAVVVLFLAPAVYWAAEVAKEHEEATKKLTAPGGTTTQTA